MTDKEKEKKAQYKEKEAKRYNESYKKNYDKAVKQKDQDSRYKALADLEQNIEDREENLKNMNPNSPEYEKTKDEIDQAKSELWEKKNETRLDQNTQKAQDRLKEISKENGKYSKAMDEAIKKGDTKAYDNARNCYEKNIKQQEQMAEHLKMNNQEVDLSQVHQDRVNLHNKDCDMRDRCSENKDYENAQKYGQKVNQSLDKVEDFQAKHYNYDKSKSPTQSK